MTTSVTWSFRLGWSRLYHNKVAMQDQVVSQTIFRLTVWLSLTDSPTFRFSDGLARQTPWIQSDDQRYGSLRGETERCVHRAENTEEKDTSAPFRLNMIKRGHLRCVGIGRLQVRHYMVWESLEAWSLGLKIQLRRRGAWVVWRRWGIESGHGDLLWIRLLRARPPRISTGNRLQLSLVVLSNRALKSIDFCTHPGITQLVPL